METKQYTNYAFISYKREDEKWAKWLQHKLEHYKLPAVIRAERSDLPKYIRPVFRDGTDLSGGVLADQLRNELLRSKYLIIICSPNATKSEWVNKEASTFIEEGRLEQIIPFIVEGTPHASNPTEECFPLALQKIPAEKELLGINVQEVGKDMAFIRLVATMLGVRFDTLWQRYEREKRKKRNWMISAAIAAFLCVSGVAYWMYWQNHQTKKANWKMMENQARVIAEKASQLVDEGDSYLARLILMDVLPEDLDRPNKPYVVEAEDALRKACQTEECVLRGHSKTVYTLSYSPDGLYVASGSADHTIRLWAVKDGRCLRMLKGHADEVLKVSFSKDGKLLVSASKDKTVRIWDVESGKCIKVLNGHRGWVRSALFSPDMKSIISASSDSTVLLWNMESDVCTGLFLERNDLNELAMAFSPDGKEVATSDNNGVLNLYNVADGKVVHSFNTGQRGIWSIAYAPSSNRIATAAHDTLNPVCIWDAISGERLHLLPHPSYCHEVAYSPDGKRIATACWDGKVYLWNAINGTLINTFEGSGNLLLSVSFGPDNNHVAFSGLYDDIIYHREIDHHDNVQSTIPVSSSNKCAFSNDGKFAAVSRDSAVAIYEIEDNKLIKDYHFTGSYISSFEFSDDNMWLAISSGNGRIGIVNVMDNWRYQQIDKLDEFTWSMKFTHDSQYLVANTSHYLYKWNILHPEFNKEPFPIVSRGRMLLSSDNHVIIEGDSTYTYMSLDNGCLIDILNKEEAKFGKSISPDGKYLAFIPNLSWDSIAVLDLASYQIVKKIGGHQDAIFSIEFSPDSKSIVTSSQDGTARIYDWRKGECMHVLTHHAYVRTAAYNTTGDYIVTTSDDGCVRVWGAYSGYLIYEFKQEKEGWSWVQRLDKDHIIITDYDDAIIVIDFPSLQQLIDETRERFKDRVLTQEEQRKYYLE